MWVRLRCSQRTRSAASQRTSNAAVVHASAFQPRVILVIPTQEIVLSVAGQSGYLLPRGTNCHVRRLCWNSAKALVVSREADLLHSFPSCWHSGHGSPQ